ncbi:helix-turn-helix domain-containing protein [Parafrankia sp. FMc2]
MDGLAVELHKTTGTIRNWRTRGYGPRGFKVGNTVLYRRTEVDRWLAEQEQAEADRRVSA